MTGRFAGMQFRTKVVMFTMSVCLLAVGADTTLRVIGDIANLKESVREQLQREAQILGDVLGPALVFDDADMAAQTLGSLQSDPIILMAHAYKSNGVEAFASYLSGEGTVTPRDPAAPTEVVFKSGVAEIYHTILSDDEAIGQVYIKASLAQMQARVRSSIEVSLMVSLVLLLLVYVLVARMCRKMLRPLANLSETSRLVSENQDYTARAEQISEDELGDLTASFNEMLEQIEAKNGLLTQARDDLELRVEERTCDLRKAVSKSRNAARSLAESENRIRAIIVSIGDAIVSMSDTGVVQSFNPAAERMFEFGESEAIGRLFDDMITGPDDEDFTLQDLLLESAVTSEALVDDTHADRQICGITAEGSHFPIQISLSTIEIDSKRVVVAAIRDISQQRKAEEERNALHQKLVTSSRQAGMAEVATGVLHNIGNVLNSVNVVSEVVTQQIKESKISSLRRVADLVVENSEDFVAFIREDRRGQGLPVYLQKLASHLEQENESLGRDMFDLGSHIEHMKRIVTTQQSLAKVSGVIEPIRPKELIDAALSIHSEALKRSGVRVVQSVNDVQIVHTDRHKVLQILVNLISNAQQSIVEQVQFEPTTDPVIAIEVQLVGDDSVAFSVSDTGIGIEEANKNKIFTHGFTTKSDGHGFGLHSAALSAKEMGGSLTLTSDGVGRGATFRLTLPLVAAQ